MSAVDSDVYSWLLMNSDLFPSSNRNKTKNENVAGDIGEDEDILNVLEKEIPKQDNQVSKVEVQRSNSLDGLSAEEKRQRRLEKNREIARNCRKRKRERLGKMEEELKHLREENGRLKLQLRSSSNSKWWYVFPETKIFGKHKETHREGVMKRAW